MTTRHLPTQREAPFFVVTPIMVVMQETHPGKRFVSSCVVRMSPESRRQTGPVPRKKNASFLYNNHYAEIT